MKTGLVALLLVLLVVSSASAQPIDDQMRTEVRSGNLKLWTGMALIVGGAFIMPSGKARPNDAWTAVGFGAVGAGTWLVWSGFQQRRRAVAPHTELGVALGRRTGVMIRRRW